LELETNWIKGKEVGSFQTGLGGSRYQWRASYKSKDVSIQLRLISLMAEP